MKGMAGDRELGMEKVGARDLPEGRLLEDEINKSLARRL